MRDNSEKSLSNPRAELALLSAASRGGPKALAEIASVVREEWFTSADRAVCWRVLHAMLSRGLPVDLTLIEDSMVSQGMPLETAKKMGAALSETMPTSGVWGVLAERVESYYVRRKGVEVCQNAMNHFMDLQESADGVLELAEAELFALHNKKSGRGMRHIGESAIEALQSIMESIQNRGHVTGGLATGFTGLDRMNIKGLRRGHIWILSAPPGGGKTVMMMKMAWNMATASGDYKEFDPERHPAVEVGVFTLEMDDVQLAERILILLAKVELHKMQRGMPSRGEQEKIKDAVKKIKASKLHMEHCPGITIQELRVRVRYAVARFNLKIVFVDYAQLISSSSKGAQGNRTQEMVDVSKGLKMIADECGVPVVVLAQPKQETWGVRAGLNALGETSQLAKDADFVGMLGIWDPKKLKLDDEKDDEWPPKDAEPDEDPGAFAYLDVVKNRHGANTVGKAPIKLRWEKDFFDFISTNDRLFDPQGKEVDR